MAKPIMAKAAIFRICTKLIKAPERGRSRLRLTSGAALATKGATKVPVALTNTPTKVATKPTAAKRAALRAHAPELRQPGDDQNEDAENAHGG